MGAVRRWRRTTAVLSALTGPVLATALAPAAMVPTATTATVTPAIPTGSVWSSRGPGSDTVAPLGSMAVTASAVGADDAWQRVDAGGRRLDGSGITVAVIDTGIATVPGLDAHGKVVVGPDFSGEQGAQVRPHRDGFGHGTHMAGIVGGAGRGFSGVAPGAQLLDLKVASADGTTEVASVIDAIDWTVAHRRDHGMDVRVINLSYSAPAGEPLAGAPLAAAVQRAADAGIVVVAAVGNSGGSAAVTMPAAAPSALAVGALDHQGTAASGDDRVATLTNQGADQRRPDVLAPGRSVVSLRAPGSHADVRHPGGRVGQRFMKATGTSQAAAVVSGAAALLLQARPALTPAQVKALIVSTAAELPAEEGPVAAGRLDVVAALDAQAAGAPSRGAAAALGGTAAADGAVAPWAGRSWTGRSWTGRSWTGRSWTGRSWTGRSWTGRSWTGRSWTGRSWTGRSWTADDWAGRSWTAEDWAGRSWTGRSWTGRSWTADSWT